MRIVVTDTLYPEILRDHLAAHPGIQRASYGEQLSTLLHASFGTSDAYAHHLRELGHDAINLIVNCEPLQLAWAREHGFGRRLRMRARLPTRRGRNLRHHLLQEIAEAQIEAIDPEVVLIHDMFSMAGEALDRLRSVGRYLVTQVASVHPPAEAYGRYDLILSSFHHFVRRFREEGLDSEYFPLGFYERVSERLARRGVSTDPTAERSIPISFVGGMNPETYPAGTPALERLAEEIPLETWGYDAERLRADSPLRRRYRGNAWGLDMYEILASSRVTVNRHGAIAQGQANSMRLYEATGMGAALLTESAWNLDELFAPGVEVVAYEGPDDLIEKAKWLLERDDERATIAAAGQARTLREHTYRVRMRELSGMLEERL